MSNAAATHAERAARNAWKLLHDDGGCRCEGCEIALRALRRFFAGPGQRMAEPAEAIAAAKERWQGGTDGVA